MKFRTKSLYTNWPKTFKSFHVLITFYKMFKMLFFLLKRQALLRVSWNTNLIASNFYSCKYID